MEKVKDAKIVILEVENLALEVEKFIDGLIIAIENSKVMLSNASSRSDRQLLNKEIKKNEIMSRVNAKLDRLSRII